MLKLISVLTISMMCLVARADGPPTPVPTPSPSLAPQQQQITLSDSNSSSLVKYVIKMLGMDSAPETLTIVSLSCNQIPGAGYMCTVGLDNGQVQEVMGGESEDIYNLLAKVSPGPCFEGIMCVEMVGTTTCKLTKKGIFGNHYSCNMVVVNF